MYLWHWFSRLARPTRSLNFPLRPIELCRVRTGSFHYCSSGGHYNSDYATVVISQGGSIKVSDVTMAAKVDVVFRTTSNFFPGSVITIHHVVTEYRPHGSPGPHSPAIPNVGDRAAAYLVLDNAGTYKLVAEGETVR